MVPHAIWPDLVRRSTLDIERNLSRAQGHERDRRFREHGVGVVERYPADRCYDMPDDVVAGFLRLLRLNG